MKKLRCCPHFQNVCVYLNVRYKLIIVASYLTDETLITLLKGFSSKRQFTTSAYVDDTLPLQHTMLYYIPFPNHNNRLSLKF